MTNMKEDELCMWFNGTTLELADEMTKLFPKSLISTNLKDLKNLIKMYPKKLIELFVIYVLPDKEEIDNENEKYFLENSFNKHIKDDNNLIKQMFQFKTIWKQLDDENKKTVISYMKFLCEYAQQYFMLIYS
ncbi:MAG: hypothetical protein Edafosvirus32_7 [Edafosvirus sp.]|uniref:Uncharacterized protein n=1 Tax=Edafosvirus sp. TaxID=2487765 RepID=A0A3G4ZV55_9VIRU|nr:MAG: hypothetical protein Edafosvirus32_7 [Edafosvirus sp.]